jgi:hypothetical protein
MNCPRCGSQNVDERVRQVAYVVNHHYAYRRPDQSQATLEDYGEVIEILDYECRSCGYAGEGDEDWTRTLNEVREDETLDWADAQYDERRMER